jgi:hypothetical protein
MFAVWSKVLGLRGKTRPYLCIRPYRTVLLSKNVFGGFVNKGNKNKIKNTYRYNTFIIDL